MPIWINALGIGGIGIVYGYVLFYALKRYLPPISQKPPSLRELFLTLAALGVGGTIGASVVSLDGVNYIGPYGLGLFFGSAINILVTIYYDSYPMESFMDSRSQETTEEVIP